MLFQTKSSIIYAAHSWTNRVVSIKITTDRMQTSLAGDVSSVDCHTMTTGCVKMATSCLAAALYILNNCPIHSRYVRRGIGKRQVFEVGQFLLNQVRNFVEFLCMWQHHMLVQKLINSCLLLAHCLDGPPYNENWSAHWKIWKEPLRSTKILFVGVASHCLHPHELPMLKQHIITCHFLFGSVP